MTFVFAPTARAVLPVTGTSDMFPVNRVFCVGRNYAAHAREMGHNPTREAPFFFQKNADCLVTDGQFRLPPARGAVHHEIELAVALQSGGSNIPRSSATGCIFGYGVALDLTLRDLQAELKKLGRPWEVAKAFPNSAPCSMLQPAARIGHPTTGDISLAVNGTARQRGDLADMIWPVADLISALSRHFVLAPGDIILTGTPDGVGPVSPGDVLRGTIAGVGTLDVSVV